MSKSGLKVSAAVIVAEAHLLGGKVDPPEVRRHTQGGPPRRTSKKPVYPSVDFSKL